MVEDLATQLRRLHDERNRELRTRWQRDLPFADAQFDRWERAERLGFGPSASIYDSAHVFGDVRVGADTWIGPYTMLDGSGGVLRIGDWCCISMGVQIYTHDTVARFVSGGRADRRAGGTTVEDRCYLGPNAVVAAGATVGEGSIVGSGSFVNRDVAAGTVVVGSPARKVGEVVVAADGSVSWG
jgi:carbonic anhydrase/acetyltransferase-like protein (isoleucine patch superfamily)